MEDQHNPAAVGAFVLALGAALIALVLWLAAGLDTRAATLPYSAVLNESVSGLSVDAPVKFMGVDVGKVKRISLDPGNPQQVVLDLRIERGTPIRQDSQAVLSTQGLTGISFLEISGGSAAAPLLLPADDGTPARIATRPSLSARLDQVVTRVLSSVEAMSRSLSGVFDAGTRDALKSTLADTATVAHALASQEASIRSGLHDAARTAQLAAAAAERLQPTLARIESAAQGLQAMVASTERAGNRVALAADGTASGVQQVRSETLPEISRLITELDELSATVRRLGTQTERSPTSLLLGSPGRAPGPGEGGTR
jgi:phospholipid/cholesterol/gamma-HCH transport system substrate-binding protein